MGDYSPAFEQWPGAATRSRPSASYAPARHDNRHGPSRSRELVIRRTRQTNLSQSSNSAGSGRDSSTHSPYQHPSVPWRSGFLRPGRIPSQPRVATWWIRLRPALFAFFVFVGCALQSSPLFCCLLFLGLLPLTPLFVHVRSLAHGPCSTFHSSIVDCASLIQPSDTGLSMVNYGGTALNQSTSCCIIAVTSTDCSFL